jgi:hypothetical protein
MVSLEFLPIPLTTALTLGELTVETFKALTVKLPCGAPAGIIMLAGTAGYSPRIAAAL